ncbi:hypothetical protein F4776DRAFT_668421 [Hypoxylon sp. NC0597]|nr:hypothetical protein F4776DRAFT_668421 [Hypoxylon sp. NC0597]
MKAAGELDIQQEIEEVQQASTDAILHQSHDWQTQQQEDRMLKEYEEFLKFMEVLPEDEGSISEHEREVKMFIIFVVKHGIEEDGKDITYQTLSNYKSTMVFWVDYFRRKHGLGKLADNFISSEMTRAMQLGEHRKELEASRPHPTNPSTCESDTSQRNGE